MLFKKLSNEVIMPMVGLGTFKSVGEEVKQAVKYAINAGYKHIDTAEVYKNEELIGEAILELNINREEIFITSKVPSRVKTYDECVESINTSLKNLKTSYIDLYLIHWPKDDERNYELYRALEDYYEKGILKAIGVSNFQIHHLEHLMQRCKIIPMMNQIELHPGLQQYPLVEFCQKHNICVTSYGPLMKGQVFEMPQLKNIALKHNKSIVNIIVRWGIERGICMIPKSVSESRIIENYNVFDFKLDEEDLKEIRLLNMARRVYSDPDNTDF